MSRSIFTPRKPLLLFSIALCLPSLHAQSIAGTWQGTLPSGQDPRLVIHLTQPTNNHLAGTLTFIDRGATGAPLLSVTFAPPDLSLAVGEITYKGRLSPDGRTITGTYTRGAQSFPLTLTLATPETLWTYTGPAPLTPMPATAHPVFEVATIRPSRPDANGPSISSRGHLFEAKNVTLVDLIEHAYRLRDRQIEGGPAWKSDLRFDITAEPDIPGQPNPDQARAMLQKLLADRFGLQYHTTHPITPVYALTRKPTAAPLTPAAPGSNGYGSIYVHDQPDGNNTAVQFAWTSIADFLDTLMNFIPDRQIVDETGLHGQYDFTLTIPTSLLHGGPAPEAQDKASAFLAAIPKAGFALAPKKEPLEVLVIDGATQPSPN